MGETVVVGAVGGPVGVNGWMHVKSFTQPADNILDYRPWRLKRDACWQSVATEAQQHRDGFVARIDGVADRDRAAAWRGAAIGVSADVLPATAPDEYYWRDLAGLQVRATSGESLGRVARLFATSAHDVMVVADGERERLIPFVRRIVAAVDVDAGQVVVDWRPDWP